MKRSVYLLNIRVKREVCFGFCLRQKKAAQFSGFSHEIIF